MKIQNYKTLYPNRIIRLIRFCKENNLYNYICLKYKSLETLNFVLLFTKPENYIQHIMKYIPPLDNSSMVYTEIMIEKYDLLWKEYAQDIILDDIKTNEILNHFQKYYSNLSYLNDKIFFYNNNNILSN